MYQVLIAGLTPVGTISQVSKTIPGGFPTYGEALEQAKHILMSNANYVSAVVVGVHGAVKASTVRSVELIPMPDVPAQAAQAEPEDDGGDENT